MGFGFRHSKTDTHPDGERTVSAEGKVLAEHRAQSEEVAKLVDQAPARAVIVLGGASDSMRTRETGAIIGETLPEVFKHRSDVHVIPPSEMNAFATEMGAAPLPRVENLFGPGAHAIRETVRQIHAVLQDHQDQKILITYPLTLKELSQYASVEGVPDEGRWRLGGQESQFTNYTEFLLAKAKEYPPDGNLREWFRNKGVVDGKKIGPTPEEVVMAYLRGFTRLKKFATKQVPDRPVVVGLVGHSWDLDALAVYLGNNGVIDEAGYDRVRGSGHMIKEAELVQFTINHGQATLTYRGQTVPVPAALTAEETPGWDATALAELAERGIRVEAAFAIPEERDKEGELIDADIYWVRYPKPVPTGRDEFADVLPVEGKLYLPRNPNGELIQFGPGYPGGVAGRFEQHYAKSFVDAGYAFATIRHNGTSLEDTPKTREIMNSPERFRRAREAGERFIGGERPDGYRMGELVYEPLVLLMALGNHFQRVHLMGQSFGATSIWASVDRLVRAQPEVIHKIGNLVSIAGWLGGAYDAAVDRLHGMKESIEPVIDRNLEYAAQTGMNIDTTSPTHRERMREDMRAIATRLQQAVIPTPINQVVIQSTEDPLITLEALGVDPTVSTYPAITSRSIIVHDQSGRDPRTGAWLDKQHSHLWIRPENLLRAVRANLSDRGPHVRTVRNPLPKSERSTSHPTEETNDETV